MGKRPETLAPATWNELEVAVQRSKLLPIGEGAGGLNSEFGTSVSVSGNRVLIGAPGMTPTGAAVVLADSGSGWEVEAVLTPSTGQQFDAFGLSVSLSGDRALVGSHAFELGSINTGAAYIFEFDGSDWLETAKLLPADLEPGDYFGSDVSLEGDRALIGAFGESTNGSLAGAAYVFDFAGGAWTETAKLLPGDGVGSDFFGESVSLSGERALVGARGVDDSAGRAGAAYIFGYDGLAWNEEQKLLALDGSTGDFFGRSVSLAGTRALIGAEAAKESGQAAGSAYVFDLDGSIWIQSAKLRPSDLAAGDSFGYSVSLSGDRALIGARFEDGAGPQSGSSYVFEFSGSIWSQTAKLLPSDAVGNDNVGSAVALDGDRLVAGAPSHDLTEVDTGAAWLFDHDGARWIEAAKLSPPLRPAEDRFGAAVSVDGDRALVGAYLDDGAGADSGSAYIFDYDGTQWRLTQKLVADDAEAGDQFGFSVDLSGDRALIGARYEDEIDVDTGAAYVFDFDGVEWTQTTKLVPADGTQFDRFGHSVGLSGNHAMVGSPSNDATVVDAGAVYFYEFDGSVWDLGEKVVVVGSSCGCLFGTSVSLEGDRALFGAPFDDGAGNVSGAAYIYDFDGNNWIQTEKLLASDRAAGDDFGRVVSLSGNRALIGAPSADRFGQSNNGTAYLFEYDGVAWNEVQQLLEPAGESARFYGESVSVDGNRALVGAPSYGTSSRGVYLFEFDGITWGGATQLIRSDSISTDSFGKSVSISADRYLIGAPLDDDLGPRAGAAYIHDENQPPLPRPDDFATDEDTPVSGNVLADNGFGMDSDPEGDAFSVVGINGLIGNIGAVVTLPSGALVLMDGAGAFQYDPNGAFEALGDGAPPVIDEFTYTISDGWDTASAPVRVSINGIDDAPVAVDDLVILNEDDPATGILVLANDTDVDGGPIAVASVTQPMFGTAMIIESGARVAYTPDPGTCNNGEPSDDFSYTLAPGGSSATVSAIVECLNNPPVADEAAVRTDEDTSVQVLLTGSDADEFTTLSFSIESLPTHGILEAIVPVDDTTAEVTYTPDIDYNGIDGFTFSVDDGVIGSSPATVSITVDPVNDPPSFSHAGDVIEIEDGDYAVPWASAISAGPVNEGSQSITFLTAVMSNPGLFINGPSVDAAGILSFTPAADTIGTSTIEVLAMDDGGTANHGEDLSAPVTFTIDVIAAADLVIDKSSGSFFADPGGPVRYTIVVSNPGPSDVAQAIVFDDPPDRLGDVSWTCTPGDTAACTPSGIGLIDDELVNLPEGTSVTFTLDATLLDVENDPITNTARVTTPVGVLELGPANNSDSDTDLVGLFADGMESVEP